MTRVLSSESSWFTCKQNPVTWDYCEHDFHQNMDEYSLYNKVEDDWWVFHLIQPIAAIGYHLRIALRYPVDDE